MKIANSVHGYILFSVSDIQYYSLYICMCIWHFVVMLIAWHSAGVGGIILVFVRIVAGEMLTRIRSSELYTICLASKTTG